MQSAEEEDAHVAGGIEVPETRAATKYRSLLKPLVKFLTMVDSRIDLCRWMLRGAARVLDGLDFSRHRPRFILIEAVIVKMSIHD